jgi:hypothetical protein
MNDMDMVAVLRDGFAVDQDREARPNPPKDRPRTPRSPDASGPPKPRVRITCQFRDAGAMVYDLDVGERKIEVRMQAPRTAHTGWEIGLVVKGDGGALQASGATRPLAWAALESCAGNVFGRDDCDKIREALSAVRAL